MAPKPPEPHFSTVWYISFIQLLILALPLEWLGLWWWSHSMEHLAIWSFAWFLSAEWAAGGVKDGFVGTKTGFIFWKITDRWARVVLGLAMGGLILWRFPSPLNLILGIPFTLWLPVHYWRRGIKGPVDRFFIWLAERTGLSKLLDRLHV